MRAYRGDAFKPGWSVLRTRTQVAGIVKKEGYDLNYIQNRFFFFLNIRFEDSTLNYEQSSHI